MKKIKIAQYGICHEHANGKYAALQKLPEIYDFVGSVDDRNLNSPRFAGDNLEFYKDAKWITEEELFNILDLQVEKADPLKVRLTLLEDNEEYTAGTHIIEIKNVEDRYTDQLTELAKVINGEIKNPYSYEHELLVQEVLLAASGYTIWES